MSLEFSGMKIEADYLDVERIKSYKGLKGYYVNSATATQINNTVSRGHEFWKLDRADPGYSAIGVDPISRVALKVFSFTAQGYNTPDPMELTSALAEIAITSKLHDMLSVSSGIDIISRASGNAWFISPGMSVPGMILGYEKGKNEASNVWSRVKEALLRDYAKATWFFVIPVAVVDVIQPQDLKQNMGGKVQPAAFKRIVQMTLCVLVMLYTSCGFVHGNLLNGVKLVQVPDSVKYIDFVVSRDNTFAFDLSETKNYIPFLTYFSESTCVIDGLKVGTRDQYGPEDTFLAKFDGFAKLIMAKSLTGLTDASKFVSDAIAAPKQGLVKQIKSIVNHGNNTVESEGYKAAGSSKMTIQYSGDTPADLKTVIDAMKKKRSAK